MHLMLSALLALGAATAAEDVANLNRQNVWGVLTPFWQQDLMQRETCFFVQGEAGSEQPFSYLLLEPSEVIEVSDTRTGAIYERGRDWELDPNTRRIYMPDESRMPSMTLDELFPPLSGEGLPHRDGEHRVFFGEGSTYHDRQVVVTYRHNGDFGFMAEAIPEPSGGQLPRTMAKLRGGGAFGLALLGDSISAGANASAVIDVQPEQPAYGRLVALGLQERHGSEVAYENFSRGGMRSDWGISQAEKVAAADPDLVIIAFGMNDASASVAPQDYQQNISAIVDAIRVQSPAAEFILVATMVANPDWENYEPERYAAYREALLELAGEGVVVADMTSMWTKLLQRKRFYDITGNGVNHPNDFGHRVYAQVLLALLQQ